MGGQGRRHEQAETGGAEGTTLPGHSDVWTLGDPGSSELDELWGPDQHRSTVSCGEGTGLGEDTLGWAVSGLGRQPRRG